MKRIKLTPPSRRRALRHDIKMRPIAILIARRITPLLIPLRRAQIRNLHRNLLALSRTVALAIRCYSTNILKLVAAAAATATPLRSATVVKQGGAAGCGPD